MHFHLPLHLSRKRNQINLHLFEEDWQSAITEIDCHPHDCQIWSSHAGFFDGDHESRVLPIHVACSLHAPLEVVRAIVNAYPGCLTVRESSFKRLPIHVACMFAAPEDVIEYLAREHVAGTLAEDVMGRLPLHYACSNGLPMAVVETFLSVNPASTLYADFNGWLPLHVAVHFGASTKVVRVIVRVCPAAVAMKTKKSSTALSLAEKVGTKNREEVIAVLKGAMVTGQNDTRQSSFVRRVPTAA
mmetsp:Transcript_33596/g.72640  ORF Transcript_33596/g.72640 Transcript_33596/m.72640 type:complete len:244 (-) Transcript_33596:87-818(-)